jgi:hypothetical protein
VEHSWHSPQAVLQQTLLTQLPLTQSVATLQACPDFFLHAPLALQLLVPLQLSESSAFVTATQVPPVPVQAWHVPHDAVVQQ